MKSHCTTFEIKNSFILSNFYEYYNFQAFLIIRIWKKKYYTKLVSKERSAYLLIIACSSTPETCDSFFWSLSFFYFFDGCLIHPVFATSQEEIQVVCVSLEGWLSSIRYSNTSISISTKIIMEIDQSIDGEKVRWEIYNFRQS